MNTVFETTLLALVAWLASTVMVADTTEPEIGIVKRTDCGGFWRYDFNYETVDADGNAVLPETDRRRRQNRRTNYRMPICCSSSRFLLSRNS